MKPKKINLTTILLSLCTAAGSAVLAQDLPYESGSDGSDGGFAVPIQAGVGARSGHSAAYNSTSGEVVVFGGWAHDDFGNSGRKKARFDARRFDGNIWSTLRASGITSFSSEGAMGFDKGSGKMVYFGGSQDDGALSYTTVVSDGGDWTPKNDSAPGTMRLMSMAYDDTNGELLLYGGLVHNQTGSTKTWVFDGENDWIEKVTGSNPGALYGHSMCWDATREEIVLFGGWDSLDDRPTNETWVYSPSASDWVRRTPGTSPPARMRHSIGHDPVSGKIILYGGTDGQTLLGDMWEWDGSDWRQLPDSILFERKDTTMVSNDEQLMLIGGESYRNGSESDAWVWNASDEDWKQIAGDRYWFDMRDRPNGTWNFTSVQVPSGFTIDFVPNANNSSVTWLATGNVSIDGSISLNGESGFGRPSKGGCEALGGPGGYCGGIGADAETSTFWGSPGEGPGSGQPGFNPGSAGGQATHEGVYGNAYLVPLSGGSGGGGAAINNSRSGGNGGGGGGAIAIASSRNIIINGSITANGGSGGMNTRHSGVIGGHGAGGSVKIVADRVLGSGRISALNGVGVKDSNLGGYARIEAYLKPLAESGEITSGLLTTTAPVSNFNLGSQPSITVTDVAGENVIQRENATLSNPDLIFSAAGDIQVTVEGTDIPDGSSVWLKITTNQGTIDIPAQSLQDGKAIFTASVPGGSGTIQALANYEVVPTSL